MTPPHAQSKFFDDLRAQRGEAWKVFDQRYGTWLRTVLHRRVPKGLQHLLDVDDVIQVTFAKACEQVSKMEFRGETQFQSFLLKIAKNQVNDRRRYHTRVCRDVGVEVRNMDVTLTAATRPGDRSPSSVCARGEANEAVIQAMATLPTLDREIVWLRAVEGRQWNQIAENAECSPDAANRSYRRSLRAIADRVRPHA